MNIHHAFTEEETCMETGMRKQMGRSPASSRRAFLKFRIFERAEDG
jgi:hypothetical protein